MKTITNHSVVINTFHVDRMTLIAFEHHQCHMGSNLEWVTMKKIDLSTHKIRLVDALDDHDLNEFRPHHRDKAMEWDFNIERMQLLDGANGAGKLERIASAKEIVEKFR